jgi:hypothetical protein
VAHMAIGAPPPDSNLTIIAESSDDSAVNPFVYRTLYQVSVYWDSCVMPGLDPGIQTSAFRVWMAGSTLRRRLPRRLRPARTSARPMSFFLEIGISDAAICPPPSLTYAPSFIILLLRGAVTKSVANISLPLFLFSGFRNRALGLAPPRDTN